MRSIATTHPASYPAQYYRVASHWRRVDATLSATGSIGALGVLYLILATNAPIPMLAGYGAIFGFIGWLGIVNLRKTLSIRVLLFFANRTGAVGTLVFGEALARNAGAVDAQAMLLGRIPLADFGYSEAAPDFDHDIWHALGDVLATLASLISSLREDWLTLGITDTALVLADLERFEARLRQANVDGVPFRFLLRYGDAISFAEPVFDYGYF